MRKDYNMKDSTDKQFLKDNKKIINNARARKNKFHDYPQRTDTDYDTIEDYLTGKLSNPNDKDSDKDIQM